METKTTVSIIDDINIICDAIGYRLGLEAYIVLNPVIQSLGAIKLTLIEGFKRGWNEAREGKQEVAELIGE